MNPTNVYLLRLNSRKLKLVGLYFFPCNLYIGEIYFRNFLKFGQRSLDTPNSVSCHLMFLHKHY